MSDQSVHPAISKQATPTDSNNAISRRKVIQMAGAAAASSLISPTIFAATDKVFRIGFVSPASGPLSMFAEPDLFVMEQVKKVVGNGLQVGARRYPVEIYYRDSKSRPDVAAQQTRELITQTRVDLVVASSTPATTNPVADVCEALGVPCLTNDTPWQAHFFGRGGNPNKGFKWTYHFFWGMEDAITTFTALWNKVPTNKRIGVLWPDDEDGNAWADRKVGFPGILKEQGFDLVDPGRLGLDSMDYVGLVDRFQREEVEILSGVIPPPFFQQFWLTALTKGYKPKIATMAKATEFPASLTPFQRNADGLSVEVWWSPKHPFNSGMTAQSSRDLAKEYIQAAGRNWTMPLGFKHALFEVAIDALLRSDGPGNKESIRRALATTNYHSVVGTVNFQTGPVPNISKTPLVGGQWDYRYRHLELLIVDNTGAPEIPLQARLRPIS
ncbi:MAG: ABC transporter substrate-binding protein [Oceanobacter sp.]